MAVVNWSFNDRAQWFALASVNHGGRDTEFGRLFKYQIITGIKLFVW